MLVGGLDRFEGPILGAIISFLVEALFGATGVWYLIRLGAAALLFLRFLPKDIWGLVEDRFSIRLLPVGHTLQGVDQKAAARPATGTGQARP